MNNDLTKALTSLRLERRHWDFVDLRINIPPSSFGSDAINPHTQYSNPVAICDYGNFEAIGASFTLGEGNRMVCEAADYIVSELDGASVGDLLNLDQGFYEAITNPKQLRWLSPNAGVPLMAAGLVVNTLIDAAAKAVGLPAWEYLARLPSQFLLDLLELRHLGTRYDRSKLIKILDDGLTDVDLRCERLRSAGLPVYFTTWIGHDAQSIAEQIRYQHAARGIRQFKLKISKDIERDIEKIRSIYKLIPDDLTLCVDANQTLGFQDALRWLAALSEMGVCWLEEPFAPDNVSLFADLTLAKAEHGWTCEIVTGENCPNHYTAAAMIRAGIDRFQADPCRMLGVLDTVLTSCVARIEGCHITPHAGGSSLDEQALHIQLFNLARIRPDLDAKESLTENVGFCSRYFSCPTTVNGGLAEVPTTPGLLVGLDRTTRASVKSYKDGVTWLEL